MTSTEHHVDTRAPARVSRRRVLGWGAATAVVALPIAAAVLRSRPTEILPTNRKDV